MGSDTALSENVINALANRYRHESSGGVRAEIVKTFALTSSNTPEIADVITSALNEDAGIVQFAMRGAGRLQLSASLPRLAELLSDHRTRMDAAQALAAFGRRAFDYLPALMAALDMEQDLVTRRTIEGAITRIAR